MINETEIHISYLLLTIKNYKINWNRIDETTKLQ